MRNQKPWYLRANLMALFLGSLIIYLPTLSHAGGPPPTMGKPTEVTPTVESPAPTTDKEVEAPAPTTDKAVEAPAPTTDNSNQDSLPRFPYPSAIITPVDGNVMIRLINNSGFPIKYQATSALPEEILTGEMTFDLPSLKTPINLTFTRQDGGLLVVMPRATNTPGLLEVTFSATDKLNLDTKSMTIESDGKVFLN